MCGPPLYKAYSCTYDKNEIYIKQLCHWELEPKILQKYSINN